MLITKIYIAISYYHRVEMKREFGVLFFITIVLILSIGIVSASWFSDFFAKITGQDVTDEGEGFGQATASAGKCSGSISTYCHSYDQSYSSEGAECDADPLCQWSDYDSWCQPRNMDYCYTLTSESSCQNQQGCSWTEKNIPPIECSESGGKCCLGDICSQSSVTCIKGSSPTFKGCDENCKPMVECVSQNKNQTSQNFGNLMNSGDPKRKINFLFISDGFQKEEKQIFIDIANHSLFGTSDPNSTALLKNNVYKENMNKFNAYYFFKAGEDYGDRDVFTTNSYSIYEKIYGNLKNISNYTKELSEEIDYFIFISKDNERGTSRPWPHPSLEGDNSQDIFGRVNLIYLPIDVSNPEQSTTTFILQLIHELGHTVGGFADEYYEEAKGWYRPVLSRRINVDSVGCPKWCSGEVNESTQCYQKFQDYLSCVQGIPDDDEHGQELINCFDDFYYENKITGNISGLRICNFGLNCELDTGCYWPAQGGLGFKPYFSSVMSGDYKQDYEEWYAEILRQNLADIKPQISKIDVIISQNFTYSNPFQEEDSKEFLFYIPFKLYFDNSQKPSIFLLNGRHYTISFNVNVSNISATYPIKKAPIYFNDNLDGYVAYFSLLRSQKDGFEIRDSDIFPVNLYIRYDNIIIEKNFTINLKEGRIESESDTIVKNTANTPPTIINEEEHEQIKESPLQKISLFPI